MFPVPVSALNPGNGNVWYSKGKKNVVKKGGLLGKDIIVHSETRSFRGVLDAAVNSPLAKMIKL